MPRIRQAPVGPRVSEMCHLGEQEEETEEIWLIGGEDIIIDIGS